MNKLLDNIKYWSQVFILPIYGLSFLFPRNKKIWIFGSTFGRRFADNPRYLYTYLRSNKSNIRAIWLTRNKEVYNNLKEYGHEVYQINSLKGYWFALRGGVYIYDNYSKDINFWLSGNSLKCNTWHGIPLKKIQMDNKFDLVRHPQNRWLKFKWSLRRLSDEKPSDYVLTTSVFLEKVFSSAFATNNILISNYPRVDLLNKNLENSISLISEKGICELFESNRQAKKKNVIYMPTFRESEENFFDVVNMKELLSFLEKNNIVFYIKLHPKSKNLEKFKRISHSSLIMIDKDSDPYTYLGLTDMLVTDYSSIYFDYLVTNKPIIFFPYDLENYLRQSRELYFPYEKFTPGRHVVNMEELIQAINDILIYNKDEYHESRIKIREIMFEDCHSFGCELLVSHIKRLLEIEA